MTATMERSCVLPREFLLGGNAVFTVANPAGERYTFRVRKPNDDAPFFVGWLAGPDNENDFSYLGILEPAAADRKHAVRLTAKSRAGEGAKVLEVARWICWLILHGESVPTGYYLNHEGRCGCCGRTLTVPESIERGIGPECWARLHGGESCTADRRSVWTHAADGVAFVAEVSDVAVPNWDGKVDCPSCGARVASPARKVYNDAADEVLGWEGECSRCGAELTLFND